MAVRLYAVPASHPSAAAERALLLKGAEYERIDLITTLHKPIQRVRFGGWSVPSVIFDDGTKVLGSRRIMRALDERYPDPPLYPSDEDDARAHVERAEQWGEEVLQPLARRVTWAALRHAPHAMRSYLAGAELPLPEGMAMIGAPVVLRVAVRVNGASDENVRADLMHLDSHLQRADDWIERGVLGGEQANAADLQVGASIRLMQTLGDLAPRIDARPVGELARRWFPEYPGFTPALSLPPPWLAAQVSA
jgi:glutathione S-transferase